MSLDEELLRRAIELARAARDSGEDPFGAVLALGGRIVHEGGDQTITHADPTAHAELTVVSECCRKLGTVSLAGYTLYSSTEPCAMCAGAIHWAQIARVIFSVPQSALQTLTGGRPKMGAEAIINAARSGAFVQGGLCLAEGMRVFDGFRWRSKVERLSERPKR
jgi:tRNA(Arg) A34 adenosine deaminase TadA